MIVHVLWWAWFTATGLTNRKTVAETRSRYKFRREYDLNYVTGGIYGKKIYLACGQRLEGNTRTH